jgi:predicted  nucleic acid-binding Zn-ribbon protein
MNPTLSLYRLQLIDSQIDHVQAQLQTLQKQLEDDLTIRQASEQAQIAEKNHLTSGQILRQAEAAVQAQRIKIEQTEASLYGGNVHNPKELQDLQNDVMSLKRHLDTLEDALLESMLAQEEAEKSNESAQVELEAAKAKWAEQNRNLGQEQTALQKEHQKLTTERLALIETISSEDIGLYEQLRLQRRGVAVSTLSDNACEACGSRLTPARAQSVRSAGQMAFCPSCGRILYGS